MSLSLIYCNNYLNFSMLLDTVNREGEYAVVTGGNRGIGWYTVKGLVDAGMKVIVGTYNNLRPILIIV